MYAVMFGLHAGLTIGIVTALANALMPFVEWITETMPDRRFGVFGIVLILCGFGMQSVQYWMALLDVAVR
jgi:ABC-type proline/glycine betaine transport system permease subunit